VTVQLLHWGGMDKDNRCCIGIHGPLNNHSGVNRSAVDRAKEQLLRDQDPVAIVAEEHTEHFIWTVLSYIKSCWPEKMQEMRAEINER